MEALDRVTINMIKDAAEVLKENIDYTPIITANSISPNIFFKAENLQKTGAFKIRGALNKINALTKEEAARGIVACSAGNHAQGVALAASKFGIKSHICMPANAPITKIQATKNYGAEVILVDGNFDDAADEALKLAKEKNYILIHPFEDPYIIAGQGTIGLEIMEQMPDVEQIIVPIGGGGLFSGIAVAVKYIKPSCRVIGVQAEDVASMYGSVKLKHLLKVKDVPTIADGLHVLKPGKITYQITKELADQIITVNEDEICQAILRLTEVPKIVAEGAGAASAAAFFSGKVDTSRKTVAVISGGNIDMSNYTGILARAGYGLGRLLDIKLPIVNNTAEISRVVSILAECGARILKMEKHRNLTGKVVNSDVISFTIETLGFDHIEIIKNNLRRKGYDI